MFNLAGLKRALRDSKTLMDRTSSFDVQYPISWCDQGQPRFHRITHAHQMQPGPPKETMASCERKPIPNLN